MNNHYLIHLPHSGLNIPKEFLDDYLIDNNELLKNMENFADLYLENLFDDMTKEFGYVKNNYSRLFFDPERFFDDSKEEMHLHYKLGWFYENTPLEEKPLRTTKNKEKISEYYIKYHQNLHLKTREKLQRYNKCTVIDCHSFSDNNYWFKKKNISFADIYIDYNPSSKDHFLIDTILEEFKNYHIVINSHLNRPIIPNDYYEAQAAIKAVSIKINKRLYLEDDYCTKSEKYTELKEKINNIFLKLKETQVISCTNNSVTTNLSHHLLELH